MPGLFSIFNTAKSGLFSQQAAINVTSHNIANANTDGYSRQRANMVTTTPYTMPSMDGAAGAGQLGTGVTVESIQRIRDSFLDYQFRVQNSISGQYSAQDKILSQVENVLNEPTDTSISSLVSGFFTSWQSLSKSSQNASTVAQQAYQLTNDLNNVSSQLTKIKSDTNTELKSTIVTVNGYIKQLNQLNQQIQSVTIAGQNPNDLMDSRDLILDKLSNEFGISITETDNNGINATTADSSTSSVDGDNGIAPKDSNGNPVNIVQTVNSSGSQASTFSYVSSIEKVSDGKYSVTYYKKGDTTTDANKVTLTVNMTEDQVKELDECRVLWSDSNGVAYNVDNVDGHNQITNSDNKGELTDGQTVNFSQLALFKPPAGELKGYMSVQSKVDEYQDTLNKFAKSLALSVNAIISQSSTFVKDNPTDGSGEGGINNFFVNGDQKDSSKYSVTDENNITAANITLNVAILNDPSKIKVASKYDSNGDAVGTTTDGNRALAVAQLANSLMNISGINIANDDGTSTRDDRSDLLKEFFTSNSDLGNVYSIGNAVGGSTIDNYYDDLVNKIGSDEQESKNQVTYEATQLSNFNQSRESVSGVSMDEEMTNLIQFQHCYQANAKMISTVDELLDVVINGLKR
ncbi:MAG: flagellar hook-associated protein FlgK [Clostridium tyrobutyricum]|jgi:flagellar hook-associated protein 1 FlgK|uniref:flagellar hook-associated protein FlgK n=1 Tax=Clostridium tyrobutyricum TaxID=1519 RepID=UPI00242DE4F2|nr:flagellar hook-associated protein FlgK [Clostridium tyrobutyricum]MCH4199095.1 flagellar hook-associated protein FlgK [Clostridium tyrobutyricum]MCH4259665.1 flagellar hook-associated protein FlgK [Clostridium tyrobutyricum]MCI1240124.1 flagellar hook-associated protein FlgK [Clostridium tyrobutyricum]MCI1651620.1 flagellar hook-associated protein FlgK [Clostridium tyrobutyricum]MCI1938468.1 flagellar hook-associated protein FlgK [Clostridium tyrobutyricum]